MLAVNPILASAAEGPDQTGWYQIGPTPYVYQADALSNGEPRERSIEYWLRTLYNNYWQFSEQGIQMFLENVQRINDISLAGTESSIFPDFLHTNGQEVWWSWDEKYSNKYADYDTENDLWWSPMRYALLNPSEGRDVFRFGEYVIGIDCGNITNPSRGTEEQVPKIYGYKYEDENGNGSYNDGEDYLPGWTIKLLDVDNNNKVLLSTITDANGRYEFDLGEFGQLLDYPKRVKVVEVLQDNWINTRSPDEFMIYEGNNVYGPKNFGNFKKAKITGKKFDDTNGNGVKNSNEPYLEDWKIILTNPDGSTKYKYTDEAGYYEFTDLGPGTYTIDEQLQNGWVQTEPDTEKYRVTVESGKTHSGNIFGNFQLIDISGIKYEDLNGNGSKQANEPILSGWTIKLTKPDGSTLTKITNSNGYYEFINLALVLIRLKKY